MIRTSGAVMFTLDPGSVQRDVKHVCVIANSADVRAMILRSRRSRGHVAIDAGGAVKDGASSRAPCACGTSPGWVLYQQ